MEIHRQPKAANLLIVEDNLLDAELVRDYLSEDPHFRTNVMHVKTLSAIKSIIDSETIDVLFLDLELPDSTGKKTLRAISDLAQKYPVIVMTGNPDLNIAMYAMRIGAQDYLFKNKINSESLVRITRYAIERHRLLRSLKELNRREHHLATHDSLTGLPNRMILEESLEAAINQHRRSRLHCALFFIDLDDFKRINDTKGHQIGDLVLKGAARRIKARIRKSDIVSRIGGDEFVCLLRNVGDPKTVEDVVLSLSNELQKPYQCNEEVVYVGASIGIAMYPHDGIEPDTLIRHADTAMYSAKSRNRGFQFYNEEYSQHERTDTKYKDGILSNLEEHQIRLLYQPIIDSRTRKLVFCESLVRWHHSTRGLLLPKDFIPIYEKNGFIVKVGEIVLRETSRQHRAWIGNGLPPIQFSVNISGQHFNRPDFVDSVVRILDENSMQPEWLRLEITETGLMKQSKTTIGNFMRLKSLGIKVAIDDFGSGYCSLTYLRDHAPSMVKIDKSFIDEISTNVHHQKVVKAILSMAKEMNLEVVAEGVESEEQFDILSDMGCIYVQGNYISVPVTAEKLEQSYLSYKGGSITVESERKLGNSLKKGAEKLWFRKTSSWRYWNRH